MRIQTQGYSNKVWLSSDEGVINNTMILSAPTLEKILQAVNEKYGTSFEGWSQLPAAYEVGDTVPNWNAYEKIELSVTKVKIVMGGSSPYLAIGNIIGKNFSLIGNANDQFYLVETSGEINRSTNGASQYAETFCKPLLVAAGYDILTTDVEIASYEVGDKVENWQSYILIS